MIYDSTNLSAQAWGNKDADVIQAPFRDSSDMPPSPSPSPAPTGLPLLGAHQQHGSSNQDAA